MALEVYSDYSERVKYNHPGFPVLVRRNELRRYDQYTMACHWHPDLEFAFVLDGAKDYFVNGQTLRIHKGEGIFVNSKRLHYGFSREKANSSYIVVVIHPSILGEGAKPGKDYMESKFGFASEDFIKLTEQSHWQREALTSIGQIFDEMHGETYNHLRLVSQLTSLCACIGDNIKSAATKHSDERSRLAVWNMVGYVQKEYARKITLDDIAAAGSVCRSKSCKLFNDFIGQTPNAYLTRYRIQKSCELLSETNMPVIEISMASGFQSPSYFTHIFQKETGLTPRDYRRRFEAP